MLTTHIAQTKLTKNTSQTTWDDIFTKRISPEAAMETAHAEILQDYLPDNHMYIDRADGNEEDFNDSMNRHLRDRYNIDDEVR